MYKFRLHSDEAFLILAPRWADLGPAWQIGLLALLLTVPLGLIVWLYRYELRLISGLHAVSLLSLRLLIQLVICLAIGLQPQFASIHVDETPGRVRVAVDLSASMDVVDRQSTPDEKLALARVLRLSSAEELTRKQIVAGVLSPDGMNLLQRLADRHQVEIVGFHQRSVELQSPQLWESLAAKETAPANYATDFSLPLAKVSSSRAQPLLGIVVLSDGGHNVGAPPYPRADELGKQGVPIFPVVIGSRELPNDLTILDVQAPTKVFKNATVPIEIRCKVTNLPAQEMTVEMKFDDKPVRPEHRRVIAHQGRDEVYTVRFQAKMEEAGTHALQFKATSEKQEEITLANNVATRVIRVGEEKAKILLVDGEARWEYHYLANALARDPTMALERVVFTQPRIGMLKDDQLEKAGLAKTKLPEVAAERKSHDPLFDYDCILLGDVAPEDLPLSDRKRLEKFVAERGGTLILIAGKRYLPMAYTKADKSGADPLVKLLPITQPRELQEEIKDAGFALRVTGAGKLRPFLQLELDQAAVWPELPKHFWGVVGKRKPAASVLLAPVVDAKAAPKEELDTGIVVEQNYGFGRVLFVGLDSTWRWRFRVGDVYHHRFWGQLARWSAAEKLLPAGNRLIRYGPRASVYTEGDGMLLAVRLNEELPPLKDASQARVKLLRKVADGKEDLVAVIPLSPHGRQPNSLEAKVRDLAPGVYHMELDMPQYRKELAVPSEDKEVPGCDCVRVLPREHGELLDLATNWSLMQSLAERSDGKVYTPENVEELLDRLSRRIERTETRDEQRPWQDAPSVWWLLGVLLGLLSVEWFWRKWLELP